MRRLPSSRTDITAEKITTEPRVIWEMEEDTQTRPMLDSTTFRRSKKDGRAILMIAAVEASGSHSPPARCLALGFVAKCSRRQELMAIFIKRTVNQGLLN